MDKIAKLGNLGELKHLNKDSWIVMSINSIINKQNEIIDVLNQKQPEETEHIKLHKEVFYGVKPEKQEEWSEKLWKLIERWDKIPESKDFDEAVRIQDEIEELISQLLSERTFTKEELEETKRWYWNLHYCQRNNSTDKLKSKISKLLKEEE